MIIPCLVLSIYANRPDVSVELIRTEFKLTATLARGGEEFVGQNDDFVIIFNSHGRSVKKFARPPYGQAIGLDERGNPLFYRYMSFYRDDKTRRGLMDPAYIALGIWKDVIVSHVAPDNIAISNKYGLERLVPLPKGWRYEASAFDHKTQTLALKLTAKNGTPISDSIFVIPRPGRKPYLLSRPNVDEYASCVEFDVEGNILLLRKSKPDHNGSNYDLLKISVADGHLIRNLATLDITPSFSPICVSQASGAIFVQKDDQSGWLVRTK